MGLDGAGVVVGWRQDMNGQTLFSKAKVNGNDPFVLPARARTVAQVTGAAARAVGSAG